MDSYESVAKTSCSKDSNATWCFITSTIVSNQMRRSYIIRNKSQNLRINRKTLAKAIQKWQRVDDTNSNELWAFSRRLPWKNKWFFEALRSLIEYFWNNNTRPSPNQMDVVRIRIDSWNHEPHPKHFLDTTQTQFYHKFIEYYIKLKFVKIFWNS